MNTEKVKRFVKEHKKEIIIGAVCAGIGVHYGKKHFGVSADEMKLVKELRTFDPKGEGLIKEFYDVQKSAKRCKVFTPKCARPMSDIGFVIEKHISDIGANPETTGFVVFTK